MFSLSCAIGGQNERKWTSIEQYLHLVLSTTKRMVHMTGQDSGECYNSDCSQNPSLLLLRYHSQ